MGTDKAPSQRRGTDGEAWRLSRSGEGAECGPGRWLCKAPLGREPVKRIFIKAEEGGRCWSGSTRPTRVGFVI